jgi:two-component system, OmpR family, sensor histidine kinase BaeS
MVRVTVEDGGPGVPEDALGRLFEKFYRVPEARRESRAGTGIGLAVVRGLVEAMGGAVHARRSTLGGLAIDIDLPAARVPDLATSA